MIGKELSFQRGEKLASNLQTGVISYDMRREIPSCCMVLQVVFHGGLLMFWGGIPWTPASNWLLCEEDPKLYRGTYRDVCALHWWEILPYARQCQAS